MPKAYELSRVEQIAYRGLAAREIAMVRELQQEYGELSRAIEARLHLEPGSIGMTHDLDQNTMVVRERIEPEMPPAMPPPGAHEPVVVDSIPPLEQDEVEQPADPPDEPEPPEPEPEPEPEPVSAA